MDGTKVARGYTAEGITTMLISDFMIMLERWDELYRQKPDGIIITQDDNGKISMVGKFNDGREI